MITETSSTWLLHKRASGDSSLRLRLLTCDLGVVDALYKGGRTPKKQAMLQPFTPLWVAFNNRHDCYYVQQVEIEAASPCLTGHGLFAALYVNEIINGMLKPHDPEPELYHVYQETIHALAALSLADSASIEPILRHFEMSLLNTTGYGLTLTHEAISGEPIEVLAKYQFIPDTGLVRAKQGYLGADILAFAQANYQSVNARQTAKQILRQAIAHALGGKPIESRLLFSK